jgi:uncharacterized linocin/CFP29 family protein
MAFSQAVVRKLENGFVVSITELELTERGYQPVETHNIATTIEDALDFINPKPKLTAAK